MDRAFWIALARFWPRWKNSLVIVKPETVISWHRKGFRLYWRSISKRGPCRPPISPEVRDLIRRLARENPWRARKIQAELEKLGFNVSLATVSRYLPKRTPCDDQHQRWMTFLLNHRDLIAAMDFVVVPTVRFKLLYIWFAVEHGRRELLHFNVTAHPTDQRQLLLPVDAVSRELVSTPNSLFYRESAGNFRNFRGTPAVWRRLSAEFNWALVTRRTKSPTEGAGNFFDVAGNFAP